MARDAVRVIRWGKPAAGSHETSGGLVKCVVALDPDTFAEVRRRALREGTSFAEQVRLLIEWGLMADEEPGR